MSVTKITSYGREAWRISSSQVEVTVTKRGAMMAPVTFYRATGSPIEPYYVSPWQEEDREPAGDVLDCLRGDFFCLPFGWPSEEAGVSYVPHGAPPGSDWSEPVVEKRGGVSSLKTEVRTEKPEGILRKQIFLVDGENAIYVSHELEGYDVRTPLGHHAILDCSPSRGEWRVSLGPTVCGFTDLGLPYYQSDRMYFSLKPFCRFDSLKSVPTIWADMPRTDCSRFPARPGFVDHLLLIAAKDRFPAWTAAVCPAEGFLWFSLKDPELLPTTLMWMDNGGRWDVPFSGRNQALGLEEVCGLLARGFAESRSENYLNRLGVPTTLRLNPQKPTEIRLIQGVTRVPDGFGEVSTVRVEDDGITFFSLSGKEAKASLNVSFLRDGTSAL